MKRFIEQVIAVGIALFILGLMATVLMLLLGGSVLSGLSFIIGFPIAFPMTTGLLVIIVLVIFMVRWKQTRKKP